MTDVVYWQWHHFGNFDATELQPSVQILQEVTQIWLQLLKLTFLELLFFDITQTLLNYE